MGSFCEERRSEDEQEGGEETEGRENRGVCQGNKVGQNPSEARRGGVAAKSYSYGARSVLSLATAHTTLGRGNRRPERGTAGRGSMEAPQKPLLGRLRGSFPPPTPHLAHTHSRHRPLATHRKSSISMSPIPRTVRTSIRVDHTRDPITVSFRSRVSPSSGRVSSKKL